MNTASKLLLAALLLALAVNCAAVNRGAILRSLVVPGWGELSMGDPTGYAFLASEFLLWSGMYYFNNESDLLADASHDYAVRYAGIHPGEYDEAYWIDMARYDNSGFDAGGYNEAIMRDAISLYPYDPEARQQYVDARKYSDEYAWNWNDADHRAHYSSMRRDVTHYSDYAKTIGGVIFANHLLSALNALRSSRSRERFEMGVGMNREGRPMLTGAVRF